MQSETIFEEYREKLEQYFTTAQIQKLFTRLERVCFKIAPLNPATGNTRTLLRWELPDTSPHYANEAECQNILRVLIEDLLGFLGDTDFNPRKYLTNLSDKEITKEAIVASLQTSTRIGSLELPIEYENYESGHKHDNIFWLSPFTEIVKLRTWVSDKNIVTKIQVKAYLTDRRQTGDYQTNREIRWEGHPDSPQFATRGDCIEIEAKLLAQIATFTGAPEIPEELESVVEQVLGEAFVKDSFRCPISGKEILYQEFFERIANPVHGRSGYQVGHLDPIASTGKHESSNTSWITDLGNRVQGESSLDDITDEIFYMATFHKKRLGLDWDKVQEIADKKSKTES